ncbi:MAG: MmcQ/YjbR family DNA-binding protein [Alphaproteobacteria bacterium]|nr:MmcQ/YjbR family DNA-binding protein [Alphaproteobacteria bacterium]MBV9420499.1 MmcQ/YjbR family DNA-binding protein [Alphaproteobacteria bacterium]MBV9903371.1 MmcQ/YjbR family DNA-binding protein [Alphaproteobacteria bacterium]
MTPAAARKLALSFDGTYERISKGGPEIRIGGDFFIRIGTREPDTLQLYIGSFEERDAMVEAQPELFFITDHFKSYRGLLARVSTLDAKTLRVLLKQRLRAIETKNAKKRKR